MKFGIFLSISLYGYLRISPSHNKLIFDTLNWTTWVILKMIPNLYITYFFLLSQMMSSIVFFCPGLSLNLISNLYQAQKLKLMEMHIPSPLRNIYAWRTSDSDVLHDLVPFVQFKKCEKHPWRSITFSKVAGWKPLSLPKVTLRHGCFSGFLNSANGTKLRKTSHQNLLSIVRIEK